MNLPAKLENFERAFSDRTSGCRLTCNCGKEYFDAVNQWSWDEGELEALEKNPNVTSCSYAPGTLVFDGRHFVNACNCWHKRAEAIIDWMDIHAAAVAQYLTLEKQRKQAEADASPTVKE